MDEIRESFKPLKELHSTLYDDEVIGLEKLGMVGQQVYGNLDPSLKLSQDFHHEWKEYNGGYSLQMTLPALSSQDVWVEKRIGVPTLQVEAGNYTRILMIPDSALPSELDESNPPVMNSQTNQLTIKLKKVES